jgi:hypothetical protein
MSSDQGCNLRDVGSNPRSLTSVTSLHSTRTNCRPTLMEGLVMGLN